MFLDALTGLGLPFIGTSLGAACVLLMKKAFGRTTERVLNGAAAGIMVAASVWSLLIPAIEQCSSDMGSLAFLPAAAGFALGIVFLAVLDRLIPQPDIADGKAALASDKKLMILAVTIHNIPEGMAVGVVYAGLIYGGTDITAASALTLALGIAIQNFPEGAIVSMPLHAAGTGKARSFLTGVLSGAVEPVAGALTIAAASLVIPAMPYLLSFAAGAMFYVVVEELIPEMTEGERSYVGVFAFAAGFLIMMSLDVALG